MLGGYAIRKRGQERAHMHMQEVCVCEKLMVRAKRGWVRWCAS